MKFLKILSIITLCFLWANCSNVAQPEFKKIQDIKLDEIANKQAKVNAKAVFNNPNAFGLTVTRTALDVLLEQQKVGTINQKEAIEVPANSDFTIPIAANLDLGALNEDVLNSLLSIFTNKKIKLTFDGTVTIKAIGVEVGVPVNFVQEMDAAEIIRQSGFQLPSIKWPK